MVEACNTRSVPGFFLHTSRQVLEAIDAAGSDNAYLQYDIFHMQIMEGDLAKTIVITSYSIHYTKLYDLPVDRQGMVVGKSVTPERFAQEQVGARNNFV